MPSRNPCGLNLLTHYSVPSSALRGLAWLGGLLGWRPSCRRLAASAAPSWLARLRRPAAVWAASVSAPSLSPAAFADRSAAWRGLRRLGRRPALAGRRRRRRRRDHALHLDGDVAGALADPVRPALRPRPEPLERRALVDVRLADEQRVRVEPLVVLGVRDRAGEHLVDRLARGLRCELEHRDSASCAGRPRTRSTTRRAFIGEMRTCRAIARARRSSATAVPCAIVSLPLSSSLLCVDAISRGGRGGRPSRDP